MGNKNRVYISRHSLADSYIKQPFVPTIFNYTIKRLRYTYCGFVRMSPPTGTNFLNWSRHLLPSPQQAKNPCFSHTLVCQTKYNEKREISHNSQPLRCNFWPKPSLLFRTPICTQKLQTSKHSSTPGTYGCQINILRAHDRKYVSPWVF